MKNLLFILSFLFLSCSRPDGGHATTNGIKSSPGVVTTLHRPEIKRIKELKESEQQDSLQLISMLTDLLRIAGKHKNRLKFDEIVDFSNLQCVVSGSLTYGHLFEKSRKHLIVRRNFCSSTTFLNVFILEKAKFRLVLSQVLDGMSYLNDTIKDVNGDHLKDFLVHSYSSSGCCRRHVYDVYLYQPEKGNFTKKYEFMNPTFSPAEKIIRGIGYGQPGDVELYKYKWNGLKVDTVEFIFPDSTKKSYHVYRRSDDFDNYRTGRFITVIPKEYRKVESYDWFKGIF
jgi:hypothetical protein